MDVLGVAVFALMAAATAAEAAAVLPTLAARLLDTIKALRRHFASRRSRPQLSPQDSASSLEQRMLHAGGDDPLVEEGDIAESGGDLCEGLEDTEMNDIHGSGNEGIDRSMPADPPVPPTDPPDAVRGVLRDFGQYLRERGEKVPAEWQ